MKLLLETLEVENNKIDTSIHFLDTEIIYLGMGIKKSDTIEYDVAKDFYRVRCENETFGDKINIFYAKLS